MVLLQYPSNHFTARRSFTSLQTIEVLAMLGSKLSGLASQLKQNCECELRTLRC